MGFLDTIFDNPNALQALLGIPSTGQNMPQPQNGIGSDAVAGGPMQAPPQPPVPMPMPRPDLAMAQGGGGPGIPLPMPRPDGAPPLPPASVMMPTPEAAMDIAGGANGMPLSGNNPAQTPDYTPPPPAPGRGGIGSDAVAGGPMPAPITPPLGQGGIGSDTVAGGQPSPADLSARTGAPAAPQAAPMMLPGAGAAPLPPAAYMKNNGPVGQTPGNLGGALGVDPGRLSAMMAGLGHGLSAVGRLPAGAGKGQALAAGAGGSLEGGYNAQQKEKNDLFNQSSTAFKDMLAAKSNDDSAAYKTAQSKYLTARAASLMNGGTANGTGSKSILTTPDGKVAYIESQSLKMRDQLRKTEEAKSKATGMPIDEDKIDKAVDGYRDKLYKQFKIDPKEAEKIKTRGETQDNAFDTKGMTLDQFHQNVPMGAWYKDQNGVPRQRTVPPPGANAQPAPQAAPSAAVNADDQAAMSNAA